MLIPIPVAHIALDGSPIEHDVATDKTGGLNVQEYYRLRVLRGRDYEEPLDNGPFASRKSFNNRTTEEFTKAFDNAGTFSFAENVGSYEKYEKYVRDAATYRDVEIPNCKFPASLFVGPRRESFGISLGETFDALNIRPVPVFDLGSRAANYNQNENNEAFYDGNSLDRFNIISFVLEIHPSCLQNNLKGDVLGAWVRKFLRCKNF